LKIIILTAGKGERLMPLTRNTPKALLDMGNGNTLLEEQLERIKKSQVIDEVILVIGYLGEQIEAKIKMHLSIGMKIKTIFNPFFDMSGNLISLWLAKHEMNDDFLITNGDNLFTPDVFEGLIKENKDGIFLSVSVKEKYDEDDMKVALDNNLVTKVSKLNDKNQTQAESPGLVLISGAKARMLFRESLELMVRDHSYINKFWLEVFNLMHEKGIPIYSWKFDGSSKWQEIDFHIDVNKAKELLKIKNL